MNRKEVAMNGWGWKTPVEEQKSLKETSAKNNEVEKPPIVRNDKPGVMFEQAPLREEMNMESFLKAPIKKFSLAEFGKLFTYSTDGDDQSDIENVRLMWAQKESEWNVVMAFTLAFASCTLSGVGCFTYFFIPDELFSAIALREVFFQKGFLGTITCLWVIFILYILISMFSIRIIHIPHDKDWSIKAWRWHCYTLFFSYYIFCLCLYIYRCTFFDDRLQELAKEHWHPNSSYPDVIQNYYGCCGWRSNKEWSGSINLTGFPLSCCYEEPLGPYCIEQILEFGSLEESADGFTPACAGKESSFGQAVLIFISLLLVVLLISKIILLLYIRRVCSFIKKYGIQLTTQNFFDYLA